MKREIKVVIEYNNSGGSKLNNDFNVTIVYELLPNGDVIIIDEYSRRNRETMIEELHLRSIETNVIVNKYKGDNLKLTLINDWDEINKNYKTLHFNRF